MTLTEKRKVTRAYGEFLSRYEWTHFLTLTSASPFAKEIALAGHFENSYVPLLEKLLGGKMPWFWAAETSPGGRLHLHALVAAEPNRRATRWLEEMWQLGDANVRPYDRQRGAAFYVAKYVLSGKHEFNICSYPLPKPSACTMPIAASELTESSAHNVT